MKKCIFLFAAFFFFVSAPRAFAAGCTGTGNCYWIGGTGNSSDTTHWATTDGGATTGGLPSAADNCNFTANSSAANAAYTFTVDASTACKDFVMAGPGGGNKVTWAGSSALTISGSINLSGGTTGITRTFTGTITMNQVGGTATLTSTNIIYASAFIFNGLGTTFQLIDGLNTAGNFTLTAGTFDGGTNSKAVTISSSGRTITPTVPLSFYNLTVTPTSASKLDSITLAGNITVTNLFTISDGATGSNRVLISSNTIGTPRTITASSVSISNADFMDITGAGSASWDMSTNTGDSGSGDCGGNSMKSLGTAAFPTGTTRHWINASSGNWSVDSNWATSTAGTAGATFPKCQDDVYFDKAFGTSQIVTSDMPRLGRNIDWTGATWTTALTWTNSGILTTIYGSVTLISNLTVAGVQSMTIGGRGATSFTSHNVVLTWPITVSKPGATLTLVDFFSSSNSLTLVAGTLDSASNNVQIVSIATNTSAVTRALIMGSSLFTITGAASSWGVTSGTGFTLTTNTSTIKYTDTTNTNVNFSGSGFTYYNVFFSRGASTGNIAIIGNNNFYDLKDNGTGAHSMIFTAGGTQQFQNFHVSGNSSANITINSTNTSTFTLTELGTAQFCSDYLNIQHSVAIGNWYAGSHSVNNQATATAGSGWNFMPCSHSKIQGGTTTIRGGTTTIK